MNLVLIQARMSSGRFPGKVINELLGKPMILRQIERVNYAKNFDKLIVLTSTDSSDDILCNILKDAKLSVIRGSLADVHSRFKKAIVENECENIIRLTADCPLIDFNVLDKMIDMFANNEFDYLSNTQIRTFPRGLDVEIFKKQAFLKFSENSSLTSYQKEHVTPYFYQNPDKFKLGNFSQSIDFSRLRWTVDTETDFEFVKVIYEALYPTNSKFSMQDILEFLKSNPKLNNYEV
jgi:spore coat polysaccharide biosynthesis protein SpsF